MEYPQKVVKEIDEFQILKNLKNHEDFFWFLGNYCQVQLNVINVMFGSVSKTSDIIEMLNEAFGG